MKQNRYDAAGPDVTGEKLAGASPDEEGLKFDESVPLRCMLNDKPKERSANATNRSGPVK